MNPVENDWLQTRQSLLGRLKNLDDNASWQQFFDTYGRLIRSIALKAGLTETEAQDAVQETVIALAKAMPGFQYDRAKCKFKTWLWYLTRRRIADQFRKRQRRSCEISQADAPMPAGSLLEEIPDPASLELEAAWDEEFEHNLLAVATAKVKAKVNAEQYQIFDLYVLRELPVEKVMGLLHVSRTQVYLAKHRVTKLLKAEVKCLQAETS